MGLIWIGSAALVYVVCKMFYLIWVGTWDEIGRNLLSVANGAFLIFTVIKIKEYYHFLKTKDRRKKE